MDTNGSKFSDEFLFALGNWQRGWREDQNARLERAEQLMEQCRKMPIEFRRVSSPCYRKRFLHKGELTDVILGNHKSEGLTSWTTERVFAERFKGLVKENAVTAAIFEHVPSPREVILSIPSLWCDPAFESAVNSYGQRHPEQAATLLHFRDGQGEVILEAPLRGSEIIALTGVSSPFDDLCDRANIPECERDAAFKKLVEAGVVPEQPQYTPEGGGQRVIARTIERMHQRLTALADEQTT